MRLPSRFMVTAWMLPVLIAISAVFAVRIEAETGTIYVADLVVNNDTNYDSWVDFSWSYKGQIWHIDRAVCIKPHKWDRDTIRYNHDDLGPQIRLRTEIKLAGCANGTHTVLTREASVTKSGRRTVSIQEESPGRFFLTWPNVI
jgi:hypothetical protein